MTYNNRFFVPDSVRQPAVKDAAQIAQVVNHLARHTNDFLDVIKDKFLSVPAQSPGLS